MSQTPRVRIPLNVLFFSFTSYTCNLLACTYICVAKLVTWGDVIIIICLMYATLFPMFVHAVCGGSWKEKLCVLERIEARAITLAAGSYQNIFITDG